MYNLIIINMSSINNGQSAALDLRNEQLQVLLTGKFGDGCLSTPKSCVDHSMYSSNCIHEEYIDFKIKLLGELASKKSYISSNGYSKTPIWQFYTHVNPDITKLKNMDIESALNLMDDLGVAL